MNTVVWTGLVFLAFVAVVGIGLALHESAVRKREHDAWLDGFAYGFETAKRLTEFEQV